MDVQGRPVPHELTARPPGEGGIWPCGCRTLGDQTMRWCSLHRHAGLLYESILAYVGKRDEESRLRIKHALGKIGPKGDS